METFGSLSGGVLAPDSVIDHTFDPIVELQDGKKQASVIVCSDTRPGQIRKQIPSATR